jgi:hypothetical protein
LPPNIVEVEVEVFVNEEGDQEADGRLVVVAFPPRIDLLDDVLDDLLE